jgi:hypothetical protein
VEESKCREDVRGEYLCRGWLASFLVAPHLLVLLLLLASANEFGYQNVIFSKYKEIPLFLFVFSKFVNRFHSWSSDSANLHTSVKNQGNHSYTRTILPLIPDD